MRHAVHIIYKDEKSLWLMVQDDEMDLFFHAINNNEIYRPSGTDSGFWTNLSDIRYILIGEEEVFRVKYRKSDRCSADEIPAGDTDDQAKEA